MNPTQRPRPHLAPTSPHLPGRRQKSTSPLAPLPYGGEVDLAAAGDLHNNTLQLAPGATSTGAPR